MPNGTILSYRDLEVWNAAMELVVRAYKAAEALPGSERFELSAQIRKSAVSIPSNIAEGHARRGKAYRNHVVIALGSTAELETQIEVARRLGFLTAEQTQPLAAPIRRVGQMLHGLERSLRRRRVAVVSSGLALFVSAGACLFLVLG